MSQIAKRGPPAGEGGCGKYVHGPLVDISGGNVSDPICRGISALARK